MQIQGKMVMKSQIMMEVKHKVNNYENEINDGYIQNIVQEAKVNQPIEGFGIALDYYSEFHFIYDLATVLSFDKSEIQKINPRLSDHNFYYFDESLQRNLHLFEHFICLAKGLCRPGLIRLLSRNDTFDKCLDKMYCSKNFNVIMALVALIQGDFNYFERTCRDFLEDLGVKDSSELPVEFKGLKMLYLLKGQTHYTSLTDINNIYDNIFTKLFTEKSAKIKYLHKLATLSKDQLLLLFTSSSKYVAIEMDVGALWHQNCFSFIQTDAKELDIEGDSLNWLGALTLISQRFSSGFDFLAKKIQAESNLEHSKNNIYNIISSNLPEEIKKSSENIESFINFMNNLLGIEGFNEIDIKPLLSKSTINEETSAILTGINGLVNLNTSKMSLLFKIPKIKEEIHDLKAVECLLCLASREITVAQVTSIINDLIIPYLGLDIKNIESGSIEFQVIEATYHALNGDLSSLGYVADHLFFENQSSLCTLLCIISSKDVSHLHDYFSQKKLFCLKLQRDFKRFLEKLFSYHIGNNKLFDFLYKYDIDKLLMMLLIQSSSHLSLIYESKDLSFIDKDILEILESLCRDNYVPDLTKLLDIVVPYFNEIMMMNITKHENNGYLIQIYYFYKQNRDFEFYAKTIYEAFNNSPDILMNEDALLQMKEDYCFELSENYIQIDMERFLRLLLKCQKKDRESIRKLIIICFYLCKNIPEAKALLKILFYLTKDDISQVLHVMPRLVMTLFGSKLIYLMQEKRTDLYYKLVDINNSNNFINTSISIMRFVLIMLNKNKLLPDINSQKQHIYEMMDLISVNQYMFGNNIKLLNDREKQTEFILFILGLSKSHFQLIKDFGVRIGLVSERVEILFNILWKYRDTIFRNGVCNIPKLAQQLTSENITSAASFAAKAAKDEIRKAMNEGVSDFLAVIKRNSASLDKTIKDQVEKVSKLMPEKFNIADPVMLFSDMFRKFDEDESGYINFKEFCEFCKNMGFYLDNDKMLRLFSNADRDNDSQLNLREFQYAVVILKLEIAYDTLKKLEMTTEDLVWFGIMGLILLLLLFVFIFFGIVAFSKADGFNAVVNSIMPIVAGAAVAARKLDLQWAIERVKDYVETILSQIKSKI